MAKRKTRKRQAKARHLVLPSERDLKALAHHVIHEHVELRDAFAVRAPPVPDWFKPQMPPAPEEPVVPKDDEFVAALHHYEIDGHRWRAGVDTLGVIHGERSGTMFPLTDELKARVEDFKKCLDARCEQHEAYEDLRNRETLLQWPYAWADMQLARRRRRC